MSIKLFIAGTDTHVGKTYISKHLLIALNREKLTTLGIKPVASGGFVKNGKTYNPDALILQRHSSIQLEYDSINPFSFIEPVSPHLAAEQQGVECCIRILNQKLDHAFSMRADFYVIEGAGGWYTPINDKETMADFAIHHRCNTLLVVNIKLGCINHALLTEKAMRIDKANLIGWIANCKTPNIAYCEDVITTLKNRLTVTHLATTPYCVRSECNIDVKKLLSLPFISS